MPNWRKGVQGPQRKYIRKKDRVNAKQNKDIKILKKEVKILKKSDEIKVRDNQYAGITNLSSTVRAIPITDMGPWNSADPTIPNTLRMTSREGDSYLVRNYSMRGTIQIENAALVDETIARIIVVHSPDGAQPNYTDVITSNRMHAYKKIKPFQKYDILYDRMFYMQKENHINGEWTDYQY